MKRLRDTSINPLCDFVRWTFHALAALAGWAFDSSDSLLAERGPAEALKVRARVAREVSKRAASDLADSILREAYAGGAVDSYSGTVDLPEGVFWYSLERVFRDKGVECVAEPLPWAAGEVRRADVSLSWS